MDLPTIQDVRDYAQAMSKEKGGQINFITAHWAFTLNRDACMDNVRQFRQSIASKQPKMHPYVLVNNPKSSFVY